MSSEEAAEPEFTIDRASVSHEQWSSGLEVTAVRAEISFAGDRRAPVVDLLQNGPVGGTLRFAEDGEQYEIGVTHVEYAAETGRTVIYLGDVRVRRVGGG